MVAQPTPSGLQNGCDAALRVYIAGELCLEWPGGLIHERLLPGPQARHLLAFLMAEHRRAVGHEELADELWDGAPPPAWPASLKALVSRARAALSSAGVDGTALLIGAPGLYRVRLPATAWVDLDCARAAVHDAEAALAAGDRDRAGTEAFVARLISARPLLPGRSGPWVERCRRELLDVQLRSLECAVRVGLAGDRPREAIRHARLAVELAPLREVGWRLLMDAQAAAGDIGSALETYARCRLALIDALGVGPSALTRARHEALLAQAG
jgi:DNA-binding SARP family transcriptional activator